MTRIEFMAQLERLLGDMPAQERQEALAYYFDYFEDAGEENESQVIRELGSPGKVAATIKAELQENGDSYKEYTEFGYQDGRFRENGQVPQPVSPKEEQQEEKKAEENQEKQQKQGNPWNFGNWDFGKQGYGNQNYENKDFNNQSENRAKKRSSGTWALIIIAAVFVAPFLLGIGGGLLGLVFGLFGGIIGIVAALAGASLGLTFGGLVMAISGIVKLFSSPAIGLAIFGGGMIMFAIGLILTIAFIAFTFRVVPKIFRACVNGVQKLLHRGKRGERS